MHICFVFSYDTDYPTECADDDEWWYSPDLTLSTKPPASASASYTTVYLKLIEILAMAQRTLVSKLA